MKKYYIDVNGRAFGPFTLDVLQGMIEKGKLTPESRVSYNRIDWISAGDSPELFSPEQTSNGLEVATYASEPSPSYDDRAWMLIQSPGAEYGPYTGSEIIAALQDGRITPDFYVRRENEDVPRLIRDEPMFARACGGLAPSAPGAPGAGGSGAREWFFSLDGVTANGPYTVDELLDLVRQGGATIDAIVWRDGDDNSRPMRSDPTLGPLARALYRRANPAPASPVAPPAPPAGTSPYAQSFSGAGRVSSSSAGRGYVVPLSDYYARLSRRISRSYRAIWISALVCLPLACVMTFVNATETGFLASAGWAALAAIGALVSVAFFIHAIWSAIPREYVNSSPWLAVGLLFVPLFNLFWIFRVSIRATKSLNDLLTQYSFVGARYGEYPFYAKVARAVLFSCACVVAYGYFFCGPFSVGVNAVEESVEQALDIGLGFVVVSVAVAAIGIAAICFFLASMKKAAIQFCAWSSANAAEYENASEAPVTLDDVLRS